MKSQVKRPAIDHLIFQWDHKSPKSSGIKKNATTEYNKQRLLDEYFDLLAEIKPHKQELSDTKMFEAPFTLPHLNKSLNFCKNPNVKAQMTKTI